MKKLILIPIFLCAAATSGFAQSVIIPQVMAFQGYVTDADTAFTDTVGQTIVVVNLYDSAAGGNEVWSDTWDTVHVFRGYYTVTLDLSIAAGHWQGANSGFTKQYWLDAIVKGNHLTPKVQLTSAAYSFRAQVADSARAADTANVAILATTAISASTANTAASATHADSASYADTAWRVPGAPIGSVIAYAGPQLTPAQEMAGGWFICDGRAIGQYNYRNYVQSCGGIYGYTNNQDTAAYLPDLRGMFLRGVNTGPAGNRSADTLGDPDSSSRFAPTHGSIPGNHVGSIQTDTIRSHHHIAAYIATLEAAAGNSYIAGGWVTSGTKAGEATGEITQDFGGSETRPKNAYVYWIIKVK